MCGVQKYRIIVKSYIFNVLTSYHYLLLFKMTKHFEKPISRKSATNYICNLYEMIIPKKERFYLFFFCYFQSDEKAQKLNKLKINKNVLKAVVLLSTDVNKTFKKRKVKAIVLFSSSKTREEYFALSRTKQILNA